MIQPYTVAITSCGRFDLLEKTLKSLFPHLVGPVVEVLVIEDSGDRRVYEVLDGFAGWGGDIKVIFNTARLGHICSLDRMYSQIKTEWVLACEDDWEFTSGGFVTASFEVLLEFDSCSKCMLTGHDKTNLHAKNEIVTQSGRICYVGRNNRGSPYQGYLFAPGLFRMRDYRIIGPYRDISLKSSEGVVSATYFDLGYRLLYLKQRYARHIGSNRHVIDPVREVKGSKKIRRSILKRAERLKWKCVRGSNPAELIQKRFHKERSRMDRWREWK